MTEQANKPAATPATDPILVLAGVATLADALPLVTAWKQSHDALPGVQRELVQAKAAIEKGEGDTETASLVAAGKSSPELEAKVFPSMTLESLKVFASVAPVVANRGATQTPPAPPGVATSWRGKTFEELVQASRTLLQELGEEDKGLFDRVMAARKAKRTGNG